MERADIGAERGDGAKIIDFSAARHPTAPAQTPTPAQLPAQLPAFAIVAFDRRELNAILNVYGRMVAAGEWRDYAIDMLKDRAVFSIFRRTSEMPLFRIEKTPRLARRQGAFSVTAAGGLVLKRGQDLSQVLKVFDKALRQAEDR